jgi:hypothetical protein
VKGKTPALAIAPLPSSVAAGPVNPDWINCRASGISVHVEIISRVPVTAAITTLGKLLPNTDGRT